MPTRRTSLAIVILALISISGCTPSDMVDPTAGMYAPDWFKKSITSDHIFFRSPLRWAITLVGLASFTWLQLFRKVSLEVGLSKIIAYFLQVEFIVIILMLTSACIMQSSYIPSGLYAIVFYGATTIVVPIYIFVSMIQRIVSSKQQIPEI
jgi:hypothetical protein